MRNASSTVFRKVLKTLALSVTACHALLKVPPAGVMHAWLTYMLPGANVWSSVYILVGCLRFFRLNAHPRWRKACFPPLGYCDIDATGLMPLAREHCSNLGQPLAVKKKRTCYVASCHWQATNRTWRSPHWGLLHLRTPPHWVALSEAADS